VIVTAWTDDGPGTTVHDGATPGALLAGPLRGPDLTSVSLDGQLVGARAGRISRYDLDTLLLLGGLPGARGEVNTLQWTNDGRTLLATSNDQSVSLYDAPTGTRLGDPIPTDAPSVALSGPGVERAEYGGRMRRLLVAATAGLAVLAAASTAAAITSYNARPAPERAEVGAYVALWDTGDEDSTPDRFDWVCSGTMVDDDTFLTAAHCTADWPAGTRHFVSLDQDVQGWLDQAAGLGLPAAHAAEWALAQGHVVEGEPHQDPAYPGPASDTHDIGVLELDAGAAAAWWDFTPATLPAAGQLDTLGGRALDALDWWVVGYGTQEAQRGPGGHTHPGGGTRLIAPEDFNALNRTWVRLSMVAARDQGGACYGDSGGPNFVEIDGALVLAATTITGDVPCYATNVTYRVDSPSARAFLDDFVDLP
jgi:hypothetical protein